MANVLTKLMTAEEFYEWSHRPENRDKLHELSKEGEGGRECLSTR